MSLARSCVRDNRTAVAARSQPPVVLLPPDCTVGGIADLSKCLRSAVWGAVLDGSAVRRIDTAGVRLLSTFVRERHAALCVVRWRVASPELIDAVLRLEMENAVNLPWAPSSVAQVR